MSYSEETERYVQSVVAVGGEWPARVKNLRGTYPNNEAAFRTALERYVYAAHAQQAPQNLQQHQQQLQQRFQQGNYPQQPSPGQPPGPAAYSPPAHAYQQLAGGNAANAAQLHAQQPVVPAQIQGRPSYPGQMPGQMTAPAVGSPATAMSPSPAPAGLGHPSAANPGHIPYYSATRQQPHQQPGPTVGSITVMKRRPQLPNNGSSGSATPSTPQPVAASTLSLGSSLASSAPTISNMAPSVAIQSRALPQISAVKALKTYPVHPTSKQPLAPYLPISTVQGCMTTYPARSKLGLTGLLQPIDPATSAVLSANANVNIPTIPVKSVSTKDNRDREGSRGLSSSTPTVLGKRQRARVDYRERVDIPQPPSSSDEGEDEDDAANTDAGVGDAAAEEDDSKLTRAQRAAKRAGTSLPPAAASIKRSSSVTGVGRESPAPSAASGKNASKGAKENVDLNAGRSWLGQEPPSNIINVQPARRHALPYVPEEELAARAEDRLLLVPVRIELDIDNEYRVRDYFTWNLSETYITPEVFARVWCLDLDIPYDIYGAQIAQSIRNQLDDWMGTAEISLLTPEQEMEGLEADLRVIVNIDVQLGTMHLVDRVEWDLTSSLTPEAFATQMCCDLGLGGESVMLIAHAIHEELLRCKKDCLEAGLVGAVLTKTGEGGAPAAMPPVIVGGNRAPGPRRLESVWRDWNEAKSFGPHVEILTPEDIDLLEMEKDKNPRRSRKSESKWGAAAAANGNANAISQRERPGRRR